MKKYCVVVVLLSFLILSSVFSLKSFSQTESLIDSYSITLTGNALNTTSAVNVTVSIANNSTQLKQGVTFKANGASLLLSDVNLSTGVISVVWSGNITDGKLTVSGKLNPLSITPQISITKIEAAGGKDITNEVISTITTSGLSSQLTPTPTPVVETSPTPTPIPIDDASSKITINAPDILDVSSPRGRRSVVRVIASNFNRITRCTATTSDRTIMRVSPRIFPLGSSIRRRLLIARVNPLLVSSIVDGEISEEIVTIKVSCRNGAEASKEVIITAE